ncbi:SDR family oxidoreductase [Nonomuraea sp. NPDC049141]|uniref:SDR family NAD(P)-dependent oxidoreductase n=1 Tax=Nonomuraea sp. NPDC049141 TaxID=3155500 RepID=UPI0033FC63B9
MEGKLIMHDLSHLTGRTALVTGASTGIGAAFARELARRGADLVLVARSDATLKVMAESLTASYGVRVTAVPLDLSDPHASARLYEQTGGQDIDFLVNNAGVSHRGDAAEADPGRLAALVDLNVQAVMGTTLRFLPGMRARGRGVIVNVASTSAFMPIPYLAAYAASKAFVRSFTQAVSAENAGTGVRILALCPGLTDTPMTAGPNIAGAGKKRAPEQVVATAFRTLATRKSSVVDGGRNALLARVFSQRLPESFVLSVGRRLARP